MSNGSTVKMKRIGKARSTGEMGGWSIPVEIPYPVYKVWKSGYSVFPQTGGEPKVPLCEWKPFQERPITQEELCDVLAAGTEPGTWALATGHAAGLVVLDFDGEAGRKLFRRWKLRANVISRNDGRHVWVKDVPVPVKTGHVAGWPGLELKGERASVTFFGAVTEGPKQGAYQLRSIEPVSINGLPVELRQIITGQEETEADRRAVFKEDMRREEEGGGGGSTAGIAAALLRDHISRFSFAERAGESRDRAIFDYAQQMYWNRISKDEARTWARFMRDQLPDTDAKGEPQPFSDADVEEKLDSAYSGDQKEPSYLPLSKLGQRALDSERARRMARRRVDEEERELRGDNAKLHIYGPADAAALDIKYEWIIRRVLETKGHGPIAGPKKAAKSWLALLMAVSVATGIKFLGRFPVEKTGPVLYLTGEGGLENTELRLRHICQSLGLAREDVPVYVTATILTMGTDNWHRELTSAMEHIGPLVTFVDPIYPYHDESQSGILYQRGRMIMRAALPMLDAGAAAMFVDHWRKTNRGDNDLDNISGAGMGEFAHTWMSLTHLAPPDLQEGAFTLRMNTGSRLWGGDQWRLDLDTGPWNDDAMNYSGNLMCNVTEYVPSAAVEKEERDEGVVLGLIQHYPLECTTKQIIENVGFGRARVKEALARLEREGLARQVRHPRKEGDREVSRPLWEPVEAGPEVLVSKGQS